MARNLTACARELFGLANGRVLATVGARYAFDRNRTHFRTFFLIGTMVLILDIGIPWRIAAPKMRSTYSVGKTAGSCEIRAGVTPIASANWRLPGPNNSIASLFFMVNSVSILSK